MKEVAVLFARADSIYKTLPFCDVWDIERDARNYAGPLPVVAHPPCRAWGRLRHFANPRPDEKDLARFAVRTVRAFGGVLEHPAHSTLWADMRLPPPGARDEHGGFTLGLPQHWFGHKAEKATWLYIAGCSPRELPPIPLVLGEAEYVVSSTRGQTKKPELTKPEREATPEPFARWLCDVARITRPCSR